MTKEELQQLPLKEQLFIKDNHLEEEPLSFIKWAETHYDEAVYNNII